MTKNVNFAEQKELQLRSMMRRMNSVLVAFSGGVDSSYLAFIANRELGGRALCVTGISPSVSEFQRQQALKTAEKFGFNYLVVETNEIEDPNYSSNPSNRCYFCKNELYGQLAEVAAQNEIDTVLDGANHDDLNDHRPGAKAAAEFGVRSLLAEVGFSKDEIRSRSKAHGIDTWDKPSSPCLASRIKYGVSVSPERLGVIERGESFLRDLGFSEFRVRHHDELVRIEIAKAEMSKAFDEEISLKIADEFRALGFKYVTLDLHGFRSGALNEAILNLQLPAGDSDLSYNGK
ncbi:MAG: ATP-dependent sacrificial sulfur transferase LarE [Acidobacteria bacterium]|nr:ATP-dependent sacrificial sulfur transferase LarE [Acidobacteriota bacterium]